MKPILSMYALYVYFPMDRNLVLLLRNDSLPLIKQHCFSEKGTEKWIKGNIESVSGWENWGVRWPLGVLPG